MSDPTSALVPRLSEALGTAFTIEGEIGRGGMGVVYRARDEKLKRRVAIKVLKQEYSSDPEFIERFRAEARTVAMLNHPGIAAVHELGGPEISLAGPGTINVTATNGAIILRTARNVGDVSEAAFWAKIQGLVRNRNPYGTGSVAAKDLRQLVDNTIKVGAGTPPINIPPSMLRTASCSPKTVRRLHGPGCSCTWSLCGISTRRADHKPSSFIAGST